jgi:glycosyltransferase involved in cell wall biosynthesis
MKVKVFGYRGFLNIADRIELAFKNLGHEISEEPDLIYDCNGFYDDAENFYNKLEKKPKRIYTLLDVDPGKNVKEYDKCVQDLNNADIPCAISNFVADQMRSIGVNKNIEVIGYPTRPVQDSGRKFEDRAIDVLYVGRLYSDNKRFKLLKEFGEAISKQIIIAGPEAIQSSSFIYKPSDENLNVLYSHSKFVINTSYFEGLGLSPIEGVICGCYPIVMNDNKVIYELGLEPFSCDPTVEAISNKIEEISNNIYVYEALRAGLAKKFIEQYNIMTIVKKIISLYESIQ